MTPKFRTILRSTILTFVLVIVTAVATGMWYLYTFSMSPATPQEINDPNLEIRILIATQGSEFKDSIVSRVVEKLKDRPVYIKVIDVEELTSVDPDDWASIVIIHTWEAGVPPKAVSEFIKRTNVSDLVILATSGDSRNHIEGVDGITSASKLTEVDRCVREILIRIEIQIAPGEISVDSNR